MHAGFGIFIIGALQEKSKIEILSPFYSPALKYWDKFPSSPELCDVVNGSFKRLNPPRILGSGYVPKTLEAALWAFYNSNDFEEGCLMTVNLGEEGGWPTSSPAAANISRRRPARPPCPRAPRSASRRPARARRCRRTCRASRPRAGRARAA